LYFIDFILLNTGRGPGSDKTGAGNFSYPVALSCIEC
jgi:hypothetical protein